MMDLTLRVALCALLFLQKSDSFLTTKLCHRIQHGRTKSSFISIGRLEDLSWNPAQAAEFVTWHTEGPEKAGTQLAPMIKDWIGNDVGEFLTRMYLGEANQENFSISYHPSNVRNPQWIGLGEDGLRQLTVFCMKALPRESLMPEEITRFAKYFLLKEHKWPVDTNGTIKTTKKTQNDFDCDSFGGRGHAIDIAGVIGFVRSERLGYLTAEDIISMVTEDEEKDRVYMQLGEFYGNLGIKLTSTEKVLVVEGMANAGCSPGAIARLVSSIEEITEEERFEYKEQKTRLEDAFMESDAISSSPVSAPLFEIINSSGSDDPGEFEARWLPEELLQEEASKVQEK